MRNTFVKNHLKHAKKKLKNVKSPQKSDEHACIMIETEKCAKTEVRLAGWRRPCNVSGVSHLSTMPLSADAASPDLLAHPDGSRQPNQFVLFYNANLINKKEEKSLKKFKTRELVYC